MAKWSSRLSRALKAIGSCRGRVVKFTGTILWEILGDRRTSNGDRRTSNGVRVLCEALDRRLAVMLRETEQYR